MPASSRQHSLQFQRDHEKTQELLGRYVEIQQIAGGAESMYPDIAAHLALCEICRRLLDDLMTPFANRSDRPRSSRAVVLENLLGGAPAPGSMAHPPIDLVFREEIILRLGHVLPAASTSAESQSEAAANHEMPTTGHLLFYDTLSVGRLDLVVIFTLRRGNQPGTYQIEGIVSPEQPALCYRATLGLDSGILEAKIKANRLIFDKVSLDPAVGHATVTLEGRSRWLAANHPALKSSGTRSGV